MLRQRFGGRRIRITALAILASLGFAGVSAQAGLIGSRAADRATPAPQPTGYEADPHFPGAALFFVQDDAEGTIAPGTTGTAPLPDMPVPEGAVVDGSIRPAAPFRLAGSAVDRSRALQCLATAIYYEAATEPDAGQAAVAQVILNRVRHPAFPSTVCGVVYQGSNKRGCQFSFACDGSMARAPSRNWYARATRAAEAALDGAVFAPVGMATHYHTYAVTPSWNRSLVMTGVFGAHFFHRWKGYWGTPAAFTQRYAGREPMPGPLAPVVSLAAATTTATATPPEVERSARPAPLAAPTPKGASTARDAETVLPQHADSGTVLDRWADAGKPIR